jgi:hypothetical protein
MTENPNPRYTVTTSPDTDGNFEVRLRLLGNEVFAVSISADPLDKKWVSWALIISFVTVIGLAMFGEPIANFYSDLVNATATEQSAPTE